MTWVYAVEQRMRRVDLRIEGCAIKLAFTCTTPYDDRHDGHVLHYGHDNVGRCCGCGKRLYQYDEQDQGEYQFGSLGIYVIEEEEYFA